MALATPPATPQATPQPGSRMRSGPCHHPRPDASRCHGYARSLATPPSGPHAWPRPQSCSGRNSIPQWPPTQSIWAPWRVPQSLGRSSPISAPDVLPVLATPISPAPPRRLPPSPLRRARPHPGPRPPWLLSSPSLQPTPGRVSKFCKGAASSGRIHALCVRFQCLQPRLCQLQCESPPFRALVPQVQPPGLGWLTCPALAQPFPQTASPPTGSLTGYALLGPSQGAGEEASKRDPGSHSYLSYKPVIGLTELDS